MLLLIRIQFLKNFGYESYEEKNLKIDGVTSASVKARTFAALNELKGTPPLSRIGNLEVSDLNRNSRLAGRLDRLIQ